MLRLSTDLDVTLALKLFLKERREEGRVKLWM
jgi:hypothetical protein